MRGGRREEERGRGVKQRQGKRLEDTEIRETKKRDRKEAREGTKVGGGSKKKKRHTGGDVGGETKRLTG